MFSQKLESNQIFITYLIVPACFLFLITLAGNVFCQNLDRSFPADFPRLEDIKLRDINNQEISCEEFLGQGVMFVVFLPSCSKCTQKLPTIEAIRRNFQDEGLKVIGIPSIDDPGAVSRLAQSQGFDWTWIGNASGQRKKLGVNRSFEILVFDRLGKASFRITESDPKWKTNLELAIGSLFDRAVEMNAGNNGFYGSKTCAICHVAEYEQWSKTSHATSIATIQKEGKGQNVSCLACHVTGEAGRKARPWVTTPKELQEVGCEECHGPGGPHRTKPFSEKDLYSTQETSCVRCHDQKNSPNWNYATYLDKVKHSKSAE